MASLLGPPELKENLNRTEPTTTTPITDPFIDLLEANFNNTSLPPLTRTENFSATYASSGNPCLDFLFHVVPDTPKESLKQRLELSWAHDPLTTLKLVFNLRGVRGTGKSDKEGFFTSALWLHGLHPKTLACNVALAEFGCFKDLPEILYRLLEGSDVRETRKSEWEAVKRSLNRGSGGRGGRGGIRGGFNVSGPRDDNK